MINSRTSAAFAAKSRGRLNGEACSISNGVTDSPESGERLSRNCPSAAIAAPAFELSSVHPGGHFREKICSSSLLVGRVHAGSRFCPVDRYGRSRRESIVVTGSRAKDVGGVQTPDTPKAKVVLTQEIISRSEPRPDDPRHHQPGPGRQLPEQRRLWLVGRHAHHPRLRLDPHQPHLRRHPAQRQRQLRDLLQPAGRPRADRAGQRQSGLDRRRLADRLGRRRHGQLPDHDSDQDHGLPRRRLGRRLGLIAAFFGVFNTGEFGPWGTRAFVSGLAAEERRAVQQLRQDQQAAVSTRRSGSRSAPTATSSRSPATTTRTATISSARCRCAQDLTQSATDTAAALLGANSHQPLPDVTATSGSTTSISRARSTRRRPASPMRPTPATYRRSASCGTEFDRRYNPSNTGNIRGASQIHAGQRPRPHGRPQLPICEGQRRRHRDCPGGPARYQPDRPSRVRGRDVDPGSMCPWKHRLQNLHSGLFRRFAVLRARHQRRRRYAGSRSRCSLRARLTPTATA